MRRLVVFSECAVELEHPSEWQDDLALLFGDSPASSVCPNGRLVVKSTGQDTYSIFEDDLLAFADLPAGEALHRLAGLVVGLLAAKVTTGVSIHAGVVALDHKAILIAGPSSAGKSTLTAWFVEKGFSCLTDEFALLKEDTKLSGFPRAFMVKPGSRPIVSAFSRFAASPSRQYGAATMFRPQAMTVGEAPCTLIIFPDFNPDYSAAEVEVLSPAKTSFCLLSCTGNAAELPDGGFAALNELAAKATAVVLRYGDFAQIDGVLDTLAGLLIDSDMDSASARRFLTGVTRLSGTDRPRAAVRSDIPAPTPRKRKARLTIGMATYDDYDGVYFSLQALRLYHPELSDDYELLVIDNNPGGAYAASLKALETHIPNYRYIPETAKTGTSVKNKVFSEADGEYVLCMDCHVFVVPGALGRLLNYFSEHEGTRDLLQGPLLRDDLQSIYTHFKPEWRTGMFGVWGDNGLATDPDAPPFDIEMQGMGLFACRRDAWQGFNDAFQGFGGEEGYIHEKFRQAGARTLCLPFLRWVHRFGRPLGPPYPNRVEDRIWNYLVGYNELGLPTRDMEEHFAGLIGEPQGTETVAKLKRRFNMLGRSIQ